MNQLKKVTLTLAMALAIGATTIPATATVSAATKVCAQPTQSSTSCDFTKGKLNYKITGKNTCTVTGLSVKGQNSSTCTIPSKVTCNGKTYNVTNVAKKAFKNCDNLLKVNCSQSLAKKNCFGNTTVKVISCNK